MRLATLPFTALALAACLAAPLPVRAQTPPPLSFEATRTACIAAVQAALPAGSTADQAIGVLARQTRDAGPTACKGPRALFATPDPGRRPGRRDARAARQRLLR